MVGRTPLLLFLTTAALAFAGCAGDNGDGDADAAGGAPDALPARELAWSLTGCRFAVILIDVPASAVQPYVPEGFRVQSAAEVGIEGQAPVSVPNPNGAGNFGVELFACESGEGVDGPVPGMAYASYFTGVEPPAELRRDVNNHFVKWTTLIPDQERRDLLASYGLPVANGTVEVALDVGQGPLSHYAGSLRFGDEGTFEFEGGSLAALPDGSFTEYTQTPNGLAEWTMQYSLAVGGAGPQTVTIPAGSWAASIVGAGQHRGAGFAGIADFTPGSLKLPAAAPAAASA